jgi:hypothetical protein
MAIQDFSDTTLCGAADTAARVEQISGIHCRHATGASDVPFLRLARHFGELSSLAHHATIVVIKAMRDNDEDF